MCYEGWSMSKLINTHDTVPRPHPKHSYTKKHKHKIPLVITVTCTDAKQTKTLLFVAIIGH